jgi:uncharacterized surface protein with fasciclin (FAS1) repeats
MQRRLFVTVLTLLLALAAFRPVAAQEPIENVVDIVASTRNLSTLHTAIVEAGLADTLALASNNYTVFAPTNAAFGRLPEGVLDALLADPDGALTDVLLNHVVPGRLDSAAVASAGTLTTLGGETLTVEVRRGNVFINDSRVQTADIPAKNGVIHTINEVLVPPGVATLPTASEIEATSTIVTTPAIEAAEVAPSAQEIASSVSAAPTMTIAEIAEANGNFTTLLAAAEMAGLDEALASPGNYTVFAPTDDAFAAVPGEFLNLVLADVEGQLTPLLLYHVVNDRLSINQIANSTLIPTLDGRPLFITTGDGSSPVYINGAEVIISNIEASNGIIHVINAVLVP